MNEKFDPVSSNEINSYRLRPDERLGETYVAEELKDKSLSQEEFMVHLQEEGIATVRIIPFARQEYIRMSVDYFGVGPFSGGFTYATYYFSFDKDGNYRRCFVEDRKTDSARSARLDIQHIATAQKRAQELKGIFPYLEVEVRVNVGSTPFELKSLTRPSPQFLSER